MKRFVRIGVAVVVLFLFLANCFQSGLSVKAEEEPKGNNYMEYTVSH